MKIRVLKKVKMHEKLKEYATSDKVKYKVYEVGDVILNVNDKYLERFLEFPEHIEIIEKPKKAKNVTD